ncbi:hypothetical protein BGY98DRAFT_978605 [Russula aff. rugulosa BPL654]|nr:hypothetical protein BGY98DRAFT_978605 [Russula aff. rugulosa BPL654]
MDVREAVIPVSRSEEKNDESEKPWDKPSSAVHPRRNKPRMESDYESAQDSFNSIHTGTDEFQQASAEIKTPPGEMSSIDSESHRTHDEATSDGYLASNEGGPGSRGSFLVLVHVLDQVCQWVSRQHPKQVSQQLQSFFSKLASVSKKFFGKLASKLKFWRRTSESVST